MFRADGELDDEVWEIIMGGSDEEDDDDDDDADDDDGDPQDNVAVQVHSCAGRLDQTQTQTVCATFTPTIRLGRAGQWFGFEYGMITAADMLLICEQAVGENGLAPDPGGAGGAGAEAGGADGSLEADADMTDAAQAE